MMKPTSMTALQTLFLIGRCRFLGRDEIVADCLRIQAITPVVRLSVKWRFFATNRNYTKFSHGILQKLQTTCTCFDQGGQSGGVPMRPTPRGFPSRTQPSSQSRRHSPKSDGIDGEFVVDAPRAWAVTFREQTGRIKLN